MLVLFATGSDLGRQADRDIVNQGIELVEDRCDALLLGKGAGPGP